MYFNFKIRVSSPSSDNRIFLYEVIMPSPRGQKNIKQQGSSVYPRARVFWQIPASGMSQAMQRINREGGKIVKITPIVSCYPSPHKFLPFPWWVEISTKNPRCIYYFGPFDSKQEAQREQSGYIEDLQEEGAAEITATVKQCQPQVLTQEWQ